jgi:two-component system LytT family response regulator
MSLQKRIIIQEELINIKVLTKLIADFCSSKEKLLPVLPIDSLILESNTIKPNLLFIDIKPLIMQEVIVMVSKVIKKMEFQNLISDKNSQKEVQPKIVYREYVSISSINQIEFIKMADIMFCMADGKYTKFFLVNGDTFLSSKPLGNYEYHVLDVEHFFRIHNSYIINMRFVSRVDKKEGIACEMQNGVSIPISKRRFQDFCKFIKLK